MATAKDRGWGDPHDPNYGKNITVFSAAGIRLSCRREVSPLFKKLVTDVGKHYNLKENRDDWGYANRPIRGYEDEYARTHNPRYLSNHAWGLALDLDATENPMTSTPKPHEFQERIIKPLLVPYRGRIVWGGFYSGRKDYMHFEFVGTPRDAAVLIRQMGL